MPLNSSRRSAFTLIELLVVVSIVALLISLLLPALGEARRAGKMSVCKSNLHQYAVATQSYATEHKEHLWSLSWQPGVINNTQYSDLRGPFGNATNAASVAMNEAVAVAAHATDIIRRRTGRDSSFPLPANWIPTVLYNHLALQDYLGQRLPEKMVVCPEDRTRLKWQTDPLNFNSLGEPKASSDNVVANSPRWPYSSSYRMVSQMWSNDRADRGGAWGIVTATGGQRLRPASINGTIGKRRMNEVLNPQMKVMMWDDATRHFGRIPYYWNFPDSRQPFLFFDGSARVKRTGDANPGVSIARPSSGPYAYSYQPEAGTIQPPLRDGSYGASYRFSRAHFMNSTAGGLAGVDFGSAELIVR